MTQTHRVIFPTMFVLFIFSDLGNADLVLNRTPPLVELAGDDGGRLDGSSWNSSELEGTLSILMYVDPDRIKVNEHVENALANEKYPPETIKSVAIANLAATWKPKFLITKILKRKQKQYPGTIYLTDKRKVLVKQWGLHDHSYNVLVFGQSGSLLFNKFGALLPVDVGNLTNIIWSQLSK